MKRRLRKKVRTGEFRQYGFEVAFQLSEDVDEAALDAFWDRFIESAVDAAGLMCGGRCGRAWDVFVRRPGRGSATDEDRHALAVWLERQPLVSDVRIGPLVDAWHAVPETKKLWREEAERRLNELESGNAAGIPAETVIKTVRSALR